MCVPLASHVVLCAVSRNACRLSSGSAHVIMIAFDIYFWCKNIVITQKCTSNMTIRYNNNIESTVSVHLMSFLVMVLIGKAFLLQSDLWLDQDFHQQRTIIAFTLTNRCLLKVGSEDLVDIFVKTCKPKWNACVIMEPVLGVYNG